MIEETTDVDQVSREVESLIYDGLLTFDNNRARSRTKDARMLGMSDLGGCREYMRATIAGDPKEPERELKWAAFVGTALGDYVEMAMGGVAGVKTQHWISVTLPTSGIVVSGNSDVIHGRNRLIDLKSKDGLDSVIDEGPSYQQWVQVSGYLVGLVQAGEMDAVGSTATLLFLDRSGGQGRPLAFTITYRQAMSYLEDADERLEDVAKALATDRSQGELRDQPESWCFYVGCPFYSACWGEEYQGQGVIDAPQHIAAMQQYDRGRALKKKADQMMKEAKTNLGAFLEAEPPQGEGGGFRLKWTLSQRGGFISRTIDLRRVPKSPKKPLSQKEIDSWG